MSDINLINGDCLEKLKDIPDKSINLVLIDPPYNIGKDKWDKWKTVEDYVKFMGKVFLEIQRVLKDNGSFYFFHNDFTQMAKLQIWIEENTNFEFQQMLVWNKRFNGASNKGFLDGFIEVNNLRNYQKMAEYCLFYTFKDKTGYASKDKTGMSEIYQNKKNFRIIKDYLKEERLRTGLTINQIGMIYNKYVGKPNVKDNRRIVGHYFKDHQWCLPTKEIYENVLQSTGYFQKPYDELKQEYEKLKNEYENKRYTYNNQKIHHSVMNYETAPKQGHITPKPVELLEYIIKTSSNENDIVLDCFMGSGSTGVACKHLNRRFIGIEIDKKYFEIAKNRIELE